MPKILQFPFPAVPAANLCHSCDTPILSGVFCHSCILESEDVEDESEVNAR